MSFSFIINTLSMQLISPEAYFVLSSAGDMVMAEKGLALPSWGSQFSGPQSFHL